jgi:hypothetical protein
MAAWTWMRYSYAWEYASADNIPDPRKALPRYYIRLTGIAWYEGTTQRPVNAERRGLWWRGFRFTGCAWYKRKAQITIPQYFIISSDSHRDISDIADKLGIQRHPVPNQGSGIAVTGRVVSFSPTDTPSPPARAGQVRWVTDYGHIHIDTAASRLCPASIPALVVGAMGCFIFGLYLRRWLIDRKALASQPGQDMIA